MRGSIVRLTSEYCFLLSFCLAGAMNVKGQMAENDSLLHVYKTAVHDSVKINALNSLAVFYYDTYPDSTLFYAKEAFSIAVKNKNLQKQAQVLQTIGVAYDYKGNLDSCLHYLGKSLEIYESLKLRENNHMLSQI